MTSLLIPTVQVCENNCPVISQYVGQISLLMSIIGLGILFFQFTKKETNLDPINILLLLFLIISIGVFGSIGFVYYR